MTTLKPEDVNKKVNEMLDRALNSKRPRSREVAQAFRWTFELREVCRALVAEGFAELAERLETAGKGLSMLAHVQENRVAVAIDVLDGRHDELCDVIETAGAYQGAASIGIPDLDAFAQAFRQQ